MVTWLDGSNSEYLRCPSLSFVLANALGIASRILPRNLTIPWMLLLKKKQRQKPRIKTRPLLQYQHRLFLEIRLHRKRLPHLQQIGGILPRLVAQIRRGAY